MYTALNKLYAKNSANVTLSSSNFNHQSLGFPKFRIHFHQNCEVDKLKFKLPEAYRNSKQ